MPRSDNEPSKIVPLMTRGEAENFFTYQTIGTGILWLMGGLTGGFSLAMVAACGLGAALNRIGAGKTDDVTDQEVERQLLARGLGQVGIAKYRRARAAGLGPRESWERAVDESHQTFTPGDQP